MMDLSEIWGASDKPDPKAMKETLNDKAWTRHYLDEVINKGMNAVFDGWIGKRIMLVLDCSPFELADIASCNYDAFTLERAKELAVKVNKYRAISV